jgi:4-amino-4-deoxy-L-arabinose transferase-like glycosyltransferase
MRKQAVAAVLAGLALRLGFVEFFPTTAGDTKTYLELAQNLLDAHTYGLVILGQVVPVDVRPPGYPLFVAAVYAIFGRSDATLRVAQAIVDLAGCFLIAALAARLAPERTRGRVGLAGLWLAAMCPFVANYAAVPLTEVLAVFLTSATLLLLVRAWQREETGGVACDRFAWLGAGAVAGLATLVRAESPLLLAAAGLAIGLVCVKRRQWQRIVRTGIWLAAGLLLPLLPWGLRNWATLGHAQLLAPRYAEFPGEYVPRGFYAWTGTWLVRFRDVYLAPWKLEVEQILVDDLPAAAFDSPAERERVASLLDDYNESLAMTPEIDDAFASLARERTRRHPLRTWLWVPLNRVATLWLTPRVDLLPYTGHVWPLGEKWEDDREDLLVTAGLWLVNLFFLALAVLGLVEIAHARDGGGGGPPPGTMFLVAFLVVRTLFMTQVETPEPRYVLVCFPAVLALAAQFWARGIQSDGKG